MVEEEFPEEAEFADGVVGDLGGSGALFAVEADAYVGFEDHVAVVGAVADG